MIAYVRAQVGSEDYMAPLFIPHLLRFRKLHFHLRPYVRSKPDQYREDQILS